MNEGHETRHDLVNDGAEETTAHHALRPAVALAMLDLAERYWEARGGAARKGRRKTPRPATFG